MAALVRLFDAYGLEAPANEWPGNVPTYDTLADACQGGVEAEIANAAIYAGFDPPAHRARVTAVSAGSVWAHLARSSVEETHIEPTLCPGAVRALSLTSALPGSGPRCPISGTRAPGGDLQTSGVSRPWRLSWCCSIMSVPIAGVDCARSASRRDRCTVANGAIPCRSMISSGFPTSLRERSVEQDEVEGVCFNQPRYRYVESGRRAGEDVYSAGVGRMQAATRLSSSSIEQTARP